MTADNNLSEESGYEEIRINHIKTRGNEYSLTVDPKHYKYRGGGIKQAIEYSILGFRVELRQSNHKEHIERACNPYFVIVIDSIE